MLFHNANNNKDYSYEHYKKEAMSLDDENTLPALKYKIIILNNDEKLGPWQSVEILNAISKEAELYWLTVQDFINVIEKTKADNKTKNQTFESFERRLIKKAKKKMVELELTDCLSTGKNICIFATISQQTMNLLNKAKVLLFRQFCHLLIQN